MGYDELHGLVAPGRAMRKREMTRRGAVLAAGIAIGALLLPCAAAFAADNAAAPVSPPGTLVKAVILSRHGVRSPTDSESELNSWTTNKDPWPTWRCAGDEICKPGQLTPRGALLSEQMGVFYGRRYDALVSGACPTTDEVFFWSNRGDSSGRTKETALSLLRGFLPASCDPMQYLHQAAAAPDPIFSPIGFPGSGCTLDVPTAEKAIFERFGDLTQYVDHNLADEQTIVESSLKCCQVSVCKNLPPSCGQVGSPCNLANQPTCVIPSTLSLGGGWNISSTFSEILLFEYASGFDPEDVGWGMDRSHMVKQFSLNSQALDILRIPYLAQLQGSRFITKILLALDGQTDGEPGTAPANAKFVAYVGHDTNIAYVAGLLGLAWDQPASGYQPNQEPPAGALVFERRTTGGSEPDRVYVYYTAQSLDAMRFMLGEHPVTTAVPVSGCSGDGSCSLAEFGQVVEKARSSNSGCWK
jgi:4-phytase/acid phosphatase